jgi:hypothetical protein
VVVELDRGMGTTNPTHALYANTALFITVEAISRLSAIAWSE